MDVINPEKERILGIQEVLLERASDLRASAAVALQKIKEVRNFNPIDFGSLADVLLVNRALGGKILGAEADAIKADSDLNRNAPILTDRAVSAIIQGSFSTSYGQWVQMFPDQADFVYLEDDRLNSAIRRLKTEPDQRAVPDERVVLNLMQLRPDQQEMLRKTFPFTDFKTRVWNERERAFKDLITMPKWLERLASMYVIDPSAREQFVLSADEIRALMKYIRTKGPVGFESVMRDVTIILADEAELDSRGQIHIRFHPAPVTDAQPLPERPNL